MINRQDYTPEILIDHLETGTAKLKEFLKAVPSVETLSPLSIEKTCVDLLHNTFPRVSSQTPIEQRPSYLGLGIDSMYKILTTKDIISYDDIFECLSNPQISLFRKALRTARYWLSAFFNSKSELASGTPHLRKVVKENPSLAYRILKLYQQLIEINTGADICISSKLSQWLENNKQHDIEPDMNQIMAADQIRKA